MKTIWILVTLLHMPPSSLWDDGRANPILPTTAGNLIDADLLNNYYETEAACKAHIHLVFKERCFPLNLQN